MSTEILLVDERNIAASFDSQTLFVNGQYIQHEDEQTISDLSIETVTANLSTSLSVESKLVELTEEELATSIAMHNGKLDMLLAMKAESESTDVDFEQFIQGYTNNDLYRAAQQKLTTF